MSTEQVSFEPHFSTLTRGGQSHFSRTSDALAEIIDNSIQACKDNIEKAIEIQIYLYGTNNSYICVMDNGCGMDTKGLAELATYSLDQNTRGFGNVSSTDKSSISKFGVGFKQAGFFLGDRIRISTKAKGQDIIRDFVMDEEVMQKKYLKKESVFTGEVYNRNNVEDLKNLPDDEIRNNKLMSDINEYVSKYPDHFTIVVFKMQPSIFQKLINTTTGTHKAVAELPKEIADIYWYHLKPRHKPESVHELEQFANCNPFKLTTTSSKRQKTSNVTEAIELHPINISMRCQSDNKNCPFNMSRLVESRNSIGPIIENARELFRFIMDIPDPNPTKNTPVSTSSTQGVQSNKRTSSEVTAEVKKKVIGIMYYCPYDNRETIPEENVMIGEDKLFSIYWQDRLVPETTVTKLPFFPSKKDVPEFDKLKKRIKGFLFFDWESHNISNNKLKIQADPNLDTWLNIKQTENKTLYEPHAIKAAFKEWIEKCHNELDKEIILKDRITLNMMSQGVYNPRYHYFKKLSFANDKIILKPQTYLKFKIKTHNVHAEIFDFEVKDNIEVDATTYFGPCFFRYKRIPTDLFSDKIYTESVTTINFNNEDTFKLNPKEIDAIRDNFPHRIKLVLFKTLRSEPVEMKDQSEIVVKEQYSKIGIQILTLKSEVIIAEHGDKSNSYSVKLALYFEGRKGIETVFDLKESVIRRIIDGKDETITDPKDRNILNECYYSFNNIIFHDIGKFKLRAIVTDKHSGDDLIDKSFNITTIPNDIDSFNILYLPPSNEIICLDDDFPSFGIAFTDQFGNQVTYKNSKNFKLSVKNEFLQVGTKFKKNIIDDRPLNNEGVVMFEKGDCGWMKRKELQDRPITSENNVIQSFELKFDITITLYSEKEEKHNNVLKMRSFYLKVRPGKPISFHLENDDSKGLSKRNPITFKNGNLINYIRLSCMDKTNSKTAPYEKNDSWKLVAFQNTSSSQNAVLIDLSDNINSYNVKIQSTGECIIPAFNYTTNLQIPPGGLHFSQKFKVDNSEHNNDIGEGFQPLEIFYCVLSDDSIDSIKVFMEDTEIDEAMTMKCGETIENLSFKLYDLHDNEILDSENLSVTISWDQKKRGKKNKTDDPISRILPPLKLSEKVCENEYFVLVSDSKKTVEFRFSISVIPDNPTHWVLLNPENFIEGVMLNDYLDWTAKFNGICLMDRFKNYISYDANIYPVPKAFLLNTQNGSSDEDEGEIMNNKIEILLESTVLNIENQNVVCHTISNESDNIFFQLNFQQSSVNLLINDSDEQFLSFKKTIKLVNGCPKQIGFTSVSMGSTNATVHQSIEVTNLQSITDVKIHLLDEAGKLANINGKYFKNFEIYVLNPNNTKHTIKKQSNLKSSTISLNYDIAPSKFVESSEQSSSNENQNLSFKIEGHYEKNDERVDLLPAILEFKIRKFNNVTKLKLIDAVVDFSMESLASDLIFEKKISTDDDMPTILIIACTDDEIPFKLPIEDIIIDMRKKRQFDSKPKKKNGELSSVDFSEYYAISYNSEEKVELTPKPSKILSVGEYILTITYEEKRDEFSSFSENERNRKCKLMLTVVSGDVDSIAPTTESANYLENLYVKEANNKISSIIASKTLTFNIFDKSNTKCSFQDNQTIVSKIVQRDMEISPLIFTDGINGIIEGAISNDRLDCIFENMNFCENSDLQQAPMSLDGEYILVFAYKEGDNNNEFPDANGSLIFEAKFQYTSNQTLINSVNEKRIQLMPLLAQKNEFQKKMNELEKLNKELAPLVKNPADVPGVMDECINRSNKPKYLKFNMDGLRSLLDRYEKEIQDRAIRTSQIRQVKKPAEFVVKQVDVAGLPCIGVLVDLGFVDDEQEAKILSWHAFSGMNALIVSDYKTATQLYKKNYKVLSLDQVNSFSKDTIRTEEEKLAGKLPIKSPFIEQSTPGNPRLLINMIQLDPDKEYLRETVFYSFFKNSLLFDDLESASAYRKILVDNKINPPSIYTIAGDRYQSTGILDPSKGGRIPEKFTYMFGEQDPSKSADCLKTVRIKERVQEIINLLEEREEIQRQIENIDIDGVEEKIRDIEEQMEEIVDADHFPPASSQR